MSEAVESVWLVVEAAGDGPPSAASWYKPLLRKMAATIELRTQKPRAEGSGGPAKSQARPSQRAFRGLGPARLGLSRARHGLSPGLSPTRENTTFGQGEEKRNNNSSEYETPI
ncbi:hypothetical protein JB92DRAFT_2833150 [Gautieria morchelliformis]|nr:hypothetical protein JB92DRAFT_2833150 [Gautieria morchelliformis]